MNNIRRTGLIMEGGAMRGMFTSGVIDVFMENNISFDGAIGVSAGAVFGCNIKSGQIGRVIRYNKKYCRDKRYASLYSLIKTGDLFGVDFCYHKIPYVLDKWDEKAYKDNPMEFYIVCTDVETGEAVYHKCMKGDSEDLLWFRASASMPLVSNIVEISGAKYLDGGIGDSIPLEYFEKIGYNKNVVIKTREEGYQKGKNSFMPLANIMLRKYPKMIKAMEERHIKYNKELEYIKNKESSGEIFVIKPPEPLNIGSTTKDPEELERVYQIGRAAAQKHLPDLIKFLNS